MKVLDPTEGVSRERRIVAPPERDTSVRELHTITVPRHPPISQFHIDYSDYQTWLANDCADSGAQLAAIQLQCQMATGKTQIEENDYQGDWPVIKGLNHELVFDKISRFSCMHLGYKGLTLGNRLDKICTVRMAAPSQYA